MQDETNPTYKNLFPAYREAKRTRPEEKWTFTLTDTVESVHSLVHSLVSLLYVHVDDGVYRLELERGFVFYKRNTTSGKMPGFTLIHAAGNWERV